MRAMETNKNFQYLQECMDWVNNQLVSDILDITSGFQTLHGFFALLTLHVALQFQVFFKIRIIRIIFSLADSSPKIQTFDFSAIFNMKIKLL